MSSHRETADSTRESASHCHCHHCDCGATPVAEIDPAVATLKSETRSVYRIINMDCPMEERLIRKKLASTPGVRNLNFNLMQRLLTVEHDPGAGPEIVAALTEIEMIPEEIGADKRPYELPETEIPWKKLLWAGVFAALSEIFELIIEYDALPSLINPASPTIAGWPAWELAPLLLALISIALGGLATFRKGWIAIRGGILNINALMTAAVIGAVLIGQFPEAAMVMILFNISEALEARALDRARKSIKNLMDLAPETVDIRQAEGSWKRENNDQAVVGDIFRVSPGQRIALDGEIIAGRSAINQAPITGESIPVDKKPGDAVFAGTINETGELEVRATATAANATLARIIRVVEEAQGSRAPVQRFVDVFAKYYTPIVFALAAVWGFAAALVFGRDVYSAVYSSLVILVIGCPCALVISTPVAVVSALAAATRKGVLIKGGAYLELGRKLNCLALDKTGTITLGRPRAAGFEIVGDAAEYDIKTATASLASRSDHPVSRCLAGVADTLKKVDGFEAIPGKGVKGRIDGELWLLGNARLARELGEPSSKLDEAIKKLESDGKTATIVMNERAPQAVFAVADAVKPSSVEALRELASLNVRTIMLTGDNEPAAKAIATEAGVDEFRAGLLPEDKLAVVAALENEGNITGMCGDGINDAPALAQANIGFAMGNEGTDAAIETADVALMDDDLRKIPAFIRLSRAAWIVLIENIVFALAVKAVFFALAFCNLATMWMAIFADVGATLIVVANSLRLMRK